MMNYNGNAIERYNERIKIEDKIKKCEIRIDQINNQIKDNPDMQLTNLLCIIRERNNLQTDIGLQKRKLYNMSQSRPANGIADWDI